jgi:hypothetical protein
MTRFHSHLAAAVAVLSASACADLTSPSNDAGNLTAGEVRALAFGVSAVSAASAEEVVWSGAAFSVSASESDMTAALHRGGRGPGGPGHGGGVFGFWGPRGLGIHGTTTMRTEREAPCPQGGSIESVTVVTAVVDTVAKTGSVSTESTDTPEACAFNVDERNTTLQLIANPNTVITITGAPSIVMESETSYSWEEAGESGRRGRFTRGASNGSQTGSFTYTTSDGRSGTCAVDLTFEFDPDTRTHTIGGTFCGQTVEESNTVPNRRFSL